MGKRQGGNERSGGVWKRLQVGEEGGKRMHVFIYFNFFFVFSFILFAVCTIYIYILLN